MTEIENNKDLLNVNSPHLPSDKINDKSDKSVKKDKSKSNHDPVKKDEGKPQDKPKKQRHYNLEATRNFMKQKRSERQHMAQLAKEEKNKVKDKSEIKKKLEDLRNKQLNILKHSSKRKADEIPEWVGIGSAGSAVKFESTEPVIITSVEKSGFQIDVPKTKARRQDRIPVKKPPVRQNTTPLPPPQSFFIDVNFPAEFLTDDRLGLTQSELKQIDRNLSEVRVKKTKQPVVNSQPAMSRLASSEIAPQADSEVNKVFQEEIKQGLEATNEFMNQVSQQMKLLTEHFKLIGDSRVSDPGGNTIAVRSSPAKDTAVQAHLTSSSLSQSPCQGQTIPQKQTNAVTRSDEWTSILPATPNKPESKRSSSHVPKSHLLNELFNEEELSKMPDYVKTQEFMSVVRRKLDFIQQIQGQEDNLDRESVDMKLPAELFNLQPSDISKITGNNCLPLNEANDIKLASVPSPSSKRSKDCSTSKSNHIRCSPKFEMNGKNSLHSQENIVRACKSDTTISESLSTDPLKLPDNIDNLSLNFVQLPVKKNYETCIGKENVELTSNERDVKLNTDFIEGLQIKTTPLFEPKKSRSSSTLSRSISEVSERISQAGSPSTSKSFHINTSKNDQSAQILTEISDRLSRAGSSKSNLSKLSSVEDFKMIKESVEEQHLNSSTVSELNKFPNGHSSTKSGHSKTLQSYRTASGSGHDDGIPSSHKLVSENELPGRLVRSNMYSSLEDIVSVKSYQSHHSSLRSYSEKKIKDNKARLEFSAGESERYSNRSYKYQEVLQGIESNKDVKGSASDTTVSGYQEKSLSIKKPEKDRHPKQDSTIEELFRNPAITGDQLESHLVNSDSSSFEPLQPTSNVTSRARNVKPKRRLSSEKNLKELFMGRIPFSSLSSNPAQVDSLSFRDHILKEMENLDSVNTNLSHALARSRALSTENLAIFCNPSTSASVGVGDNSYYPLQLSHSDTTNNQSFGSSGLDRQGDLNHELFAEQFDDPSINSSKFSLRMLENLLVDEELRYRNQAYLLDLRRQVILEKTKSELTMLSIEKSKHKARGNEEMLRNIKKRERGIVLKCQQDFKEIKRLHDVGKQASKDRILLFKSQIHLLRNHLSTNKYSQKYINTSVNKSHRKSNHSPSKPNKHNLKNTVHYSTGISLESQKRELERREAMLAARRQSLEAVMTWSKRVEDEEKRLKDVEKLITLSSGSRQVMKQGVDRGTSPLNLVCDSEFSGNKAVESSASSSEQPAETQQNRQSDKSMDNYSDSFEQPSLCENIPQAKVSEDQNGELCRRKSAIAIKIPLSPRCPPAKRRHSSGSDESILFSQNETSETSDIEVRVSSLQQQLKQRKAKLEVLRRQHSKSQREKLRVTEQALISQISAYDGYIEQLKNEIQQELESGTVKVMKPQIKQPKVAERRKSEQFAAAEKKKESEHKDAATPSEDIDISESTDSVKTLVESPRVQDDSVAKSFISESIKTELDAQLSDENRTDSIDIEISDNVIKTDSNLIKSETELDIQKDEFTNKTISEELPVSVISEHVSSDQHVSEQDHHVSEHLDKVLSNDSSINIKSDEVLKSELTDIKETESIVEEDVNLSSDDDNKEIPVEIEGDSSVKENLDDLTTVTSNVSSENAKESIKSDISSLTDSEDVKTESLLRSLELSEDKELLKLQIDVTVKSNIDKVSTDLELSAESDVSLKLDDKVDSEIEVSLVTKSSSSEILNSNHLPNLDVSPVSSLHSSENVQLMSAALMRAIEATKEDTEFEREISVIELLKDNQFKIRDDEKLESVLPENKENQSEVKASNEESTELEEFPEVVEETSKIQDFESSQNSDKNNQSALSPCNDTFIINDDNSLNKSSYDEEVSEDLMLQLISNSMSDSERLWSINLEEYRKIKEETPFLTALQRENNISDTVDTLSQHLFQNLFERAISDVFNVYFHQKESALKDQEEECYHEPDFEYYEENNETEEEKFWCDATCGERKETPSTQDEAEKLRLKQLQIEQEIEELEAAGMRGFYLREIPNKPPPPYTPPRPTKSRPTRQILTQALEVGISCLFECDVETLSTVKPPSVFLSDMSTSPDNVHRDMMWDLCKELYCKSLPPPPSTSPPWLVVSKRKKYALPQSRSKEELISWCTRQAHIIFGYLPSVRKENMIIRWSRKKRDRVDEILIRESQEEESEWIDCTVEENVIKNRIADSIIQEMISQATKAIVNAFLKKSTS